MLSVVLFPMLTGTFSAVLSLASRITQCSASVSSLCTADLGNTVIPSEMFREVKMAFTFIPSVGDSVDVIVEVEKVIVPTDRSLSSR